MKVSSSGRSRWDAVRRYFYSGTDRQRALYAGVNGVLNPMQVKQRRRAAETCRVADDRKIPPERGFRKFAPGEIPGTDAVLQFVQQWIERGGLSQQRKQKKAQLRTNNVDAEEISIGSPLAEFALQSALLELVADYLQVAPLLADIDVWVSEHSDQALANSQLYHCDWADRSQVKVFLHFSDVAAEDGPLVVLDADVSARIRRQTHYRYDSRLTDEQVHRIAGEQAETHLIGAAGTVAFVDTSRCFHYGSRLRPGSKRRILVEFQFLTPGAFNFSIGRSRSDRFAHLLSPQRSLLQRLALGIDAGDRRDALDQRRERAA